MMLDELWSDNSYKVSEEIDVSWSQNMVLHGGLQVFGDYFPCRFDIGIYLVSICILVILSILFSMYNWYLFHPSIGDVFHHERFGFSRYYNIFLSRPLRSLIYNQFVYNFCHIFCRLKSLLYAGLLLDTCENNIFEVNGRLNIPFYTRDKSLSCLDYTTQFRIYQLNCLIDEDESFWWVEPQLDQLLEYTHYDSSAVRFIEI